MPENTVKLKENNNEGRTRLLNDASYKLEFKEDGVYLEVDYGDEGGAPIKAEVVLYDIRRREIKGADDSAIRSQIKRKVESSKIAEPQEETSCGMDVMVFITKDEMTASMVVFPAYAGGNSLSADELEGIIKEKKGVTFGINRQTIEDTLTKRQFYKEIVFAQGTPAKKGEDGKITFLFTNERSYAPKIAADGSADYKSLNIFEGVEEGATVAVAIPPGEGEDGCNVKGTVLPAIRGKEAKLPSGKNVKLSDDGTSLIAEKSGRIDFVNNKVEVTDVFRVTGDVDMSTGNIRFEGDVIVPGDVIAGLSVEAKGMIEVNGNVEGATLIAGKDIVLKKGMQGMDKGKIVAGGNVVAKFLEHCDIEAQGDICADYIVHCNAYAMGSISMKGKWGKILGGTVRAGNEITANTVGSPANEYTIIELGVSPDLRIRYLNLQEEKDQVKRQLEKINSVAKVMKARNEPSERQDMRMKLIGAKAQLDNQYDDMVAEIEKLEERLKGLSGAKLNVAKVIYPNVKIHIDSCFTTTRNTLESATFVNHKGEVVFTACDVS